VRFERVAAAAPHGHRALHCLAGHKRHHHQAVVVARLRASDLHRARVGCGVVDEVGQLQAYFDAWA